MEQVGDLVGALGAADDRPERVRRDPGDVEVARHRVSRRSRRRRAGRPTARADRGSPRPARGGRRGGPPAGPSSGHRAGAPGSDPPNRSGPGRRPVRAPCRGSRSDRGRRRGGTIRSPPPATARRREAFAAGLPDRHEVMPVGIAEGADRGTERLVGVLVDVDQPGQRRGDTRGRADGARRRAGRPRAVRRPDASASRTGRAALGSTRARPPHGRLAAGVAPSASAGLGGGQEALEVTEPVASVASRVDPVVAQPAGVAPRSDRVRVHAKQPGGLGDREGRVRGSSGEGGRHDSLEEM